MPPAAAVAEPSAAATTAADGACDEAPRQIVAFFCRECAYAAADATGNARTSLPTTIRSILVPCTGRVSPLHLLTALAEGADGVYVAGCLEGQCHYREGNFHAIDRVKFCQRLLESVGVEPERVQMFTLSAADLPRFVAVARTMHRVISGLPPLRRSGADIGEATTASSTAAGRGA
jgi:coenzyme F420-reducing hydrogenase delta subunit